MEHDYAQFAGRCKEMSEAEVATDPTLSLVRGYYHCPVWGKRQHWWTVRPDGTIHDVTVRQFPTCGEGAEYEEYDGTIECEECGKSGIPEAEACIDGHHAFCTSECYARHVGLGEFL